jgi:DNA-binding MarR family transcriptional regulator
MKDTELQYIRGLTREFVRELELIKDNKYDLPLTHFLRHLLIEISLNPAKGVVDLADILLTDKGNISRGLKSLIEDKYLNTSIDSQDKRKKMLKLTSKGQKVVNTVNEYSNKRLRKAFEPVSEKNISKIVSGLELINSSLRSARKVN